MTKQQAASERQAAATLASNCATHAAVISWCADRVRATDGDPAVQDAARYLQALSTQAQADPVPLADPVATIRWCAEELQSRGGNYAVERAAAYLYDLATETAGILTPSAQPERSVA